MWVKISMMQHYIGTSLTYFATKAENKTLIVIKWLQLWYPLRYSPEIRIIKNIRVYQYFSVTLRSQINMQTGILVKNK